VNVPSNVETCTLNTGPVGILGSLAVLAYDGVLDTLNKAVRTSP